MPDWSELHSTLKGQPSPQDKLRKGYIKRLASLTKRNVIVYYSGWLQKPAMQGVNFGISDADMTGFMTVIHKLDREKGLDLVLHTPGGDMAATESLIDYLRSMFGNNIRAIVPQIAMSGGSMIACACKEIIMGKQSNIGPFDPQINGAPCQAILSDLTRALTEMQTVPNSAYVWQPIIQKYNLGFFAQCVHAIQMADEVVKKNLIACMFDGLQDAQDKANKIVSHLGSHAETKMHARHIHKEQAKDLGLKIADLEADPKLQEAVFSLHHSCILTFEQTQAIKIIENNIEKSYIGIVAAQPIFSAMPPLPLPTPPM